MTKILIVGHPLSDFEKLEQSLHRFNMRSPLLSKREKMTALEIDQALLKSVTKAPSAQDNYQLKIGAAWQGLAMDLFLGNLEQNVWGWADSQAIHLLDYWHSMDDSFRFLMVYDHPSSVLTKNIQTISEQELQQKLEDWAAYNRVLLNFHLQHKECSFLVHSRATTAREEDLKRLCHYTDLASYSANSKAQQNYQQKAGKRHKKRAKFYGSNEQSSHQSQTFNMGLEQFLAESLLQKYPQVLELYQELQNHANLSAATGAGTTFNFQSALQAWQQMVHQQQNLAHYRSQEQEYQALLPNLASLKQELVIEQVAHKETETKLTALYQQEKRVAGEFKQQLEQTAQNITALEQEKNRLTQEIEKNQQLRQAQQADIDSLRKENQVNQDENKQLVEQLHTVQESLESLYATHKQTEAQLQQRYQQEQQNASAYKQKLATTEQKIQALEQEKVKLAQEIQQSAKAQAEQNSSLQKLKSAHTESAEENKLLLQQLHTVQESLEKLHTTHKQTEAELQQRFTQEQQVANEYKQKWELTNKALDNEKIVLANSLEKLSIQDENLTYLKRQSEQEYSESQLLLEQLHIAQQELERLYADNTQLRAQLPPVMYGAAERFKLQLEYQIGQKMIEHSHSFKGWLTMPFAAKEAKKQYQKANLESIWKHLPPLKDYQDYPEAQKAKNHLSYLLGKAYLENGNNPFKKILAPFKYLKIRKEYLRNKKF